MCAEENAISTLAGSSKIANQSSSVINAYEVSLHTITVTYYMNTKKKKNPHKHSDLLHEYKKKLKILDSAIEI